MSDTVPPGEAKDDEQSAETFLEVVRSSRLVSTTDFERVEAAVAAWRGVPGPMPDGCRQALLESQLLTEWQIGRLCKGQESFFLDGFKLLKPLGQGGMGSVYLAEYPDSDEDEHGKRIRVMRKVAIKVLRTNLQGKESYRERFEQENWAAARLNHPNIRRAWDDFGEDSEKDSPFPYVVMDFIDGVDLEERVRKDGPLAVRDAAAYIKQAASGLQHAHEQGFVHRDIKPANLMIDTANCLKILDLGLVQVETAQEASAVLTREERRRSLGTPDYISPEQAKGRQAVPQSDIYSLGCTFYFLLAGRAPFSGMTEASSSTNARASRIQAHIEKQPPRIAGFRPDVPLEIERFVAWMMRKSPDARPQSAQTVVDWIDRWLAGGSPPIPAPPAKTTAPVGSGDTGSSGPERSEGGARSPSGGLARGSAAQRQTAARTAGDKPRADDAERPWPLQPVAGLPLAVWLGAAAVLLLAALLALAMLLRGRSVAPEAHSSPLNPPPRLLAALTPTSSTRSQSHASRHGPSASDEMLPRWVRS